MAHMEDVEFKERLFLKGYPFKHYSPRPGDPVANAVTPLQKPLSACVVALVTTAGLSLPDQPPFDLTIRNGDSSFREIPSDISPQLLEMHQRSWSFDQTGILRDRNLAFPLERLREMQQRGEIAALAPRCYSFMGSIVGPSKLMKVSAPEVARRLTADHVDVALLAYTFAISIPCLPHSSSTFVIPQMLRPDRYPRVPRCKKPKRPCFTGGAGEDGSPAPPVRQKMNPEERLSYVT